MTGVEGPTERRSAGDSAPTRREVLVGGGLVAVALASGLLARSASVAAPVDGGELHIPDRIGPWARSTAEGILIPQGEEPEDRIYDQVATGYYTSPSAPSVMLLIAYGSAQTGTTQLHRPEVCYPAAGFRVRKWADVPLQLPGLPIQARSMTANATGRTEQILYWSRVGRDFPTSTTDQRWSVLRHTLKGLIPDGALVRMSIIDADRSASMDVLRAFAAALVTASLPDLRRVMTGAV